MMEGASVDESLREAIRTWLTHRQLDSCRATGLMVHASKSTVIRRVAQVNRLLDSGQLHFSGGKITGFGVEIGLESGSLTLSFTEQAHFDAKGEIIA